MNDSPDRGAARNETTHRCVWLTEMQVSRCPVDVMRAWDDAPADAIEALRRCIVDDCFERGTTHLPLDEQIASVLRALGWEAPA